MWSHKVQKTIIVLRTKSSVIQRRVGESNSEQEKRTSNKIIYGTGGAVEVCLAVRLV